MNRYDSLPEAVTDLFGDESAAERAYDLLTVDVPVTDWLDALRTARDELGCTYFDWLSAVDEPGTGFRVCAHVVAVGDGAPRRLLLRTTVPHDAPSLPTAIGVYAGAAWHERETHEMFGVVFEGHPNLTPLLLPENFEGHPLRKDFVLAARVAKAWPGAKEPGESHDGGPKRRQMLPPGVPDPNEWGPLKGQLPPAPERPARGAAADRPRRTRTTTEGSANQPTTEPPTRRTRSASDGSATQPPPESPAAPDAGAAPAPRRTRSASEGSASQAAPAVPESPAAPDAGAAPAPRRTRSASDGSATQPPPESPAAPDAGAAPAPRRTRSASEGSASQTAPAAPRRTRSASQGSASQQPERPATPEGAEPTGDTPAAASPPPRTRSSDAPWHHARPAFDEPPKDEPAAGEPAPKDEPAPDTKPAPGEPAPKDEPAPDAKSAAGEPAPEAKPAAGEPAPEPKPAAGESTAADDGRPATDGEPSAEADGEPATEADGKPPAEADRNDTHPDPAGGDPA
ncbi:dehydrogenase [Streptomyces hydrogenans]|uniref:Dehydrogenase n=1 Tax=Streptomyces hydrogenans TaxID=1873719 RepID=A0ABQ3P1D4_9ACTN|nr:NADH-quinone oxidoreductase subunit C [Streptomyces hydrogenans]GHI18831.1 dehydrogenase [Streptomyces hydrogenans]